MEVTRTEIRPGVWLTHLHEDKFKTACFSMYLLQQLSRDTASLNALIPYVLRRGTSGFPDMEKISARCDELYGTVIEPVVRRIGEIQAVGFYASFPEDRFLPAGETVLREVFSLETQMLLSPFTRGGLLLPDFVDSEKDKMLELIASRINNKRSYAISRCIEEMCCFENYAVSRFGDEATCEGIRYRKLSRHYRKVLQESPIELFYCGSASRKKVCDFLRDVFSTLPRGELQDDIGTEIRMNAIESQPRTFVEEMEVAQTNLVIGWRLGECMENPDFPALYVFNELFGGSPSSRLFMNVREKLSLCYYASSLMDLRKGILLASAGVKKENCEAAREEIYTQLEAIQNGDFTEEDLETAKSGVISDLRSIPDTQIALESFWLTQAVTGADFGPLELAELIREVTKEQIIELASCVDCDMVYILQNAADTEMEEEDDKN